MPTEEEVEAEMLKAAESFIRQKMAEGDSLEEATTRARELMAKVARSRFSVVGGKDH